jgi:cobalt-zinc-cadmium efflux system protein
MALHLVLNDEVSVSQMKNLKNQLREELATFEFAQTTIELEFADGECRDDNTHA